MNSKLEFFKKFIIKTADEYIQEFDVTDRDIWVIDNYADYMLNSLENILEGKDK